MPYSSSITMIVSSLFIGFFLTLCTTLLSKNKNLKISSLISISFLAYIALQAAPTPRQTDRMIISQWLHLDYNKVSSNGLRNTVLLGCDKRGFLDGHTALSANKMFIEDIDRFFEEQKKTQKIQAFDIDPTATEKAKAYTDACAFAEKNYGKV